MLELTNLEIKSLLYVLNSRETEYPKEPINITKNLSSVEEKLNDELHSLEEPSRILKEKNVKILLVTKASGNNYSIEAGLDDGKKNFDHHGKYEKELCPCINNNIPSIMNGEIEISHIDCDTYIGLLRMIAPSLLPEKIDLNLIAEMDKNGTSVITKIMAKKTYCKYIWKNIAIEKTFYYFIGVGRLARVLNFPGVKNLPQDVTQIILNMRETNEDTIIDIGRAYRKSEETYRNCKIASKNGVGYWVIGPNNPFDPSRPYEEDGIDIVIVFRKHWKTISLYCNPSQSINIPFSVSGFEEKEIAGIQFQGHPKACESLRGEEMTREKGIEVFEEILSSNIQNFEDGFYIMKTEEGKYIPAHLDEHIDTDICDTEEEAELLLDEWCRDHDYEL